MEHLERARNAEAEVVRRRDAHHLAQFGERRQVIQVFQVEVVEEHLGGGKHRRFAGHIAVSDDAQYRNSARSADIILADYLQGWLQAGYQVLVTADHGMNNDRSHNGLLPEEREVPLFVLGDAFSLNPDVMPRQTELCGTICELLGVPHDKPLCRDLLRPTA